MSNSAKRDRLATYEDLLALPEDIVGQIIDGVLYTSPRPAGRHAYAATKINSSIDPAFGSRSGGGPGGWVFLFEPQLKLLGKQEVVPDIAGWRVSSLSDEGLAALSGNRIETIPHWICEILSPSSIRMDKVLKPSLYADCQVPYYWLVDPDQRTLEIRRLEQGQWLVVKTFEGTERVKAEPFEAIEIDLGSFWGPTRH